MEVKWSQCLQPMTMAISTILIMVSYVQNIEFIYTSFYLDCYISQDCQTVIVQDDVNLSNSTSNVPENNETPNAFDESSVSLKTSININPMSNLTDNIIISIKGVRFVDSHEMTFVQAHRANHPEIPWNPHDDLARHIKPSPTWFSSDHPWLRAVRTNDKYGLLCIDCAEFTTSEMAIRRNNGAFVVRPYWKLKHKGLEGENISLHDYYFRKVFI